MYELKIVELIRGDKKRKRLTISFHEPHYKILEEFLMVDAPMLKGKILAEIDAVLNGEKECIKSSGNRTSIVIKQHETVIHDLFCDIEDAFTPLPSLTIQTEELRKIIIDWFNAINNFSEAGNDSIE